MYRNFKEAFAGVGVPFDKTTQGIMHKLLEHGYLERGICYAMWQERDALKEAYEKGSIEGKGAYIMPQRNKRRTAKIEEEEVKELNFNEVLIEAIISWAGIKGKLRQEQEITSCIYFIQGIRGGPIKIGYTKNLKHRIAQLQTSSPEKIWLITFIPGGKQEEREIHKFLEEYRLNGEWFKPVPEVLQTIAAIDIQYWKEASNR